MTKSPPSKWAVFLFSLAAPGSGQLLAGSWSAVYWFTLVGVVLAVFAAVGAYWLQMPLLMAIGLASAWHARHLLEAAPWRPTRRATSSVQCGGARGRALAIRIEVDTPLNAAQLWRRISQLPEFLTIDPFHEQVTLTRDPPGAGVQLVLRHNAFGRRFLRFGRILWWRDGEGYAFSDLSSHGKTVGFPHIFVVHIEPPIGCENSTRLVVEVKGRWNSRIIPVWLGRWWIRLVCLDHARLLRRAL